MKHCSYIYHYGSQTKGRFEIGGSYTLVAIHISELAYRNEDEVAFSLAGGHRSSHLFDGV